MTNLLRFSIPLCIFCTVLAAASCSASHQVLATNGFADLSDADFSGGGPATVRGEWLFRALDADIPVSVPSNWKGLRIPQAGGQSITLDAWGSASYRLELALPDSPERVQDLMLRIGEAGTASTVSLNGRVIARTGTAGSTAGETVPDVRVRYLPVEPVPGINTLEITVSNFDDSNGGGLWGTLTIGKSRDIVRLHYARTIQESLLAGIFVIMCLYYLAIFLYRRSDFALLAFALICAAFFFRQVSTGEKILALVLPEIPWRTLVRIEYLSIFLLAPLYIAFFSLIYPPSGRLLTVFRVFAGIGTAGVLAVAVLPVPVFISILHAFQVYWLVMFAWVWYVLVRALREKKSDSVLLFSSYTLLVFAAVNDLLLTRLYIPTLPLVTSAQAVFIFIQSLVLSRRFAREYRQSRNLAELNEHLKALDDAKTKFFTASSHELRTPVTLITTPLEAIMDGKYGDSIRCDAPVFALVKRNCDRLKRLAEELLDFLRFDSGAVQPNPKAVDLGVWLSGYSRLFQPDAVRRKVSLSTGLASGTVARVDPVLLETVVLNLLSNALKHTPEGGTVVLSSTGDGGSVSFSVSDTGPGIPSEQLPHLFQRFSAASSAGGTGYSGFGIGLPLSAEIVKTLGGRISVENMPQGGCRFTVTFSAWQGPVDLPSDTAPDVGPSARAPGWMDGTMPAGLRSSRVPVLLVDDDVDILSFLAEMLSRTFTVITAASGAEAVTLIEDGLRPRVIVSDVMMEPMDGFALRERISGMDACAGVPFLFLSARADPEVRKSGLSAGAVDYILKPFSVEELVAKIASLASLSQAERERLERKVVEALRAQDAPPSPAGVDWRVRAREMGMTQRDLEVLDLVIRGMSDKEIAYELACSPRTISNRISALLKKTATPSRVALIALLTRRA